MPGIRKYPSRLRLELVDELDGVAMAVLTEMLCSEIRELVPLHIADANISFLHELYLGVGVEGERPQVV